ncbi:putative tripeptidyl-peptidase II [Dioscorea sansibarensis]
MQPDIIAPGVNVLAAFTQAVGPTDNDTRRVAFTMMSGTSMSCPHVAGVVGLLRALHPSWSPAMIKSAIMTTAEIYDNTGKLLKTSPNHHANPLQCGAGHIVPNRAMNPGLVYDISTRDYLNFLCNYGYKSTDLVVFTNETFSCPAKPVLGEDFKLSFNKCPFLAR